jgi:hypothetical protein
VDDVANRDEEGVALDAGLLEDLLRLLNGLVGVFVLLNEVVAWLARLGA